ncbi:hypothetical protein B5E58_11970 [Tyzzerella sp. An114]|nr:hypothetical protein B5E58_11970 [Tyzzerella sp. An114]
MNFPTQNWTRILTNNTIQRLNSEIKHRTKENGAFPNRQRSLILVCTRQCHIAITYWGTILHIRMYHLFQTEDELLSNIITD